MQNKNTIEALNVELSTLRTLLAGAMEQANRRTKVLESIINEMTEENQENQAPIQKKMLDFVNDFVEENSYEIGDELQENVFEIEMETREYSNQVTITAEKSFSNCELSEVLTTMLRKFVDDFYDQQEQEKGSENE